MDQVTAIIPEVLMEDSKDGFFITMNPGVYPTVGISCIDFAFGD